MTTTTHWQRGPWWIISVTLVLAISAGCHKQQVNTETQPKASPPETAAAQPAPAPLDPSLLERIRTERFTGDLNGMQERRFIRALVTYNRSYYFYDGAQPRGVTYEAMKEFEKFLNQKLATGDRPINVIFIPVERGDLIKGLTDGRGDISASNIAIIPEGQALIDYSDPVRENVNNIVVTGPSTPQVTSLADLGGKEVFVRKLSRYWPMLTRFNEEQKKAGKPEVILKAADENLEDEDILEMVNAGLVGITVVDSMVGELWAKVFDHITLHSDLNLAAGMKIGWAFRKNSPQLAAVVNEFVKDHKVGTAFGNTLLRRYFQDPKWIVNSTSPDEMKKFQQTSEFFKRYSGEYGFDWLMIAAQGYQESRLDQSVSSAAGAVGIMQIKPSTAAGNPININNVQDAEANVHAGVKYMRFMMDQYFKEPGLDRINRGLFAFASYNAGAAKISKLRKQAAAEGLDPNKWFNNVELVAAREIGPETVTYVSNIYKYYVAYKLVEEHNQKKKPSSAQTSSAEVENHPAGK